SSTAITISSFTPSASDTTLQAALNDAIAHTTVSSPYADFVYTINGQSDLVIVDHSSANTTNQFVPGEDAFIVIVGATTANITSSSSGHIAVA
ncbi:MAG: hypothetical protein ACP5GK_09380, partial [Desulfurella sp.]|uniref:hypothetical protein n=1 Tax=Desulfurella sp. TaxID=1962857 RepID=UPI003D0ED67F